MTTITAYARAGINNDVMENWFWQIGLINSDPVVQKIIKAMEDISGIQYIDFCSPNIKRKFTIPRQVAIIFLRMHTSLTIEKIGRLFNLKHSTVCKMLKTFNEKEFDNQFRWFYHQMEIKLNYEYSE